MGRYVLGRVMGPTFFSIRSSRTLSMVIFNQNFDHNTKFVENWHTWRPQQMIQNLCQESMNCYAIVFNSMSPSVNTTCWAYNLVSKIQLALDLTSITLPCQKCQHITKLGFRSLVNYRPGQFNCQF